jgi:DNA-binding IclR family transcriptional regulator
MPETPPQVPGTQGARRALEVLFYFNARRPNATVEQLADVLALPIATAYRLVALLRQMSILEEGPNDTYHLTPRVLQLSEALASSHGLIQVARPVLEHLVELFGETTLLVRLIDHAAVCVERVESPLPMRLTYEPGQAISAQQGASARVLIAGLTPAERSVHLDWVAGRDPEFSQRRARFEAEIDRTAAEGWAVSHGEIDAGIVAAAAPVRVGHQTLASVSIAGPAFRVVGNALDERRQAVIEAAREISESLARAGDDPQAS